MGFELLRRVRWGNVGRALGALVLVAAVVAWPRLTAPAPRVPGGDAMPLVQPGREGVGERRPESRVRPVRRRPERRVRRPERRRRRGPGRVRRRREVVVAPPAPAPAPVPPPAAPAAPPVDPAQTEFGFEGG